MQGMFSFVPFFKITIIIIVIIIIIIRWLWDLAVEVALLWKVGFCGGRKTRGPREQILRSKDENQQQTQPTRDTRSGKQTWATTLGVEHSHHCAIPAPPEGNRILNKLFTLQLLLNLCYRY